MLRADVHGVSFLDQVLQQLNVCRISKKRKVKAQFEGKQARLEGLPEQQLPSRTASTVTVLRGCRG